MASSKIQHRRQRQGSLGLPKDSPPPPQVNGSGGASGSGAGYGPISLDNLEMMKTIGEFDEVVNAIRTRSSRGGGPFIPNQKQTNSFRSILVFAVCAVLFLIGLKRSWFCNAPHTHRHSKLDTQQKIFAFLFCPRLSVFAYPAPTFERENLLRCYTLTLYNVIIIAPVIKRQPWTDSYRPVTLE